MGLAMLNRDPELTLEHVLNLYFTARVQRPEGMLMRRMRSQPPGLRAVVPVLSGALGTSTRDHLESNAKWWLSIYERRSIKTLLEANGITMPAMPSMPRHGRRPAAKAKPGAEPASSLGKKVKSATTAPTPRPGKLSNAREQVRHDMDSQYPSKAVSNCKPLAGLAPCAASLLAKDYWPYRKLPRQQNEDGVLVAKLRGVSFSPDHGSPAAKVCSSKGREAFAWRTGTKGR